jgi:hypothetical protein
MILPLPNQCHIAFEGSRSHCVGYDSLQLKFGVYFDTMTLEVLLLVFLFGSRRRREKERNVKQEKSRKKEGRTGKEQGKSRKRAGRAGKGRKGQEMQKKG